MSPPISENGKVDQLSTCTFFLCSNISGSELWSVLCNFYLTFVKKKKIKRNFVESMKIYRQHALRTI